MSTARSRHVPYCKTVRASSHHEKGVALVVALILLLVVALTGFAAVRGTVMQQRMAANQYDRQIAFQSAEAALRVGMLRIPEHPEELARRCRVEGVVCLANPFGDPHLLPAAIHDLAEGSEGGRFTTETAAASEPQYVIEDMGSWTDPDDEPGADHAANANNDAVASDPTSTTYYRITARSGDPAAVGDRAVVVLQAVAAVRAGTRGEIRLRADGAKAIRVSWRELPNP
jgi:type IV pilus assembly protein PilX